MKRIIRLTESDLTRIVRRVINEQPIAGRAYDLVGNWNKTFPDMQLSDSVYDGDSGEGKINLENGETIYFRCKSPYPRKKDMSTPFFTQKTPEYNNAYNVIAAYCKNPMNT
jgi:hypothetical protein